MKQLFETFLGMFFLFLLIVCSMTCISAGVDARNADKYKTEYIAQMENSDYAQGVIEKVFEDAAEQDYELKMVFYKDVNGTMSTTPEVSTIEEFHNLVGDTTGVYMVRLQLTFPYLFPMLEATTHHTLLGYAR